MRLRIGDLEQRRSGGSFSAKRFELTQITAQVADLADIPQTAKLVEASLRNGFANRDRQDIAIVVPYELLEQAKATRIMFMMFMGLIAAISLIVGGIGIMNIMLVSVTERTREIGVRKALGAKPKDILSQFLLEAILLSCVGGLIGIVLGIISGYFATDALSVPFVLSIPSIVLAFAFSAAVGIFFGFYPAQRAARLDPVESLRYE